MFLSLLSRKLLPLRFEIRLSVRSVESSLFENLLNASSDLVSSVILSGAMFLREILNFLFNEGKVCNPVRQKQVPAECSHYSVQY
jgi:hypothetical protein